MNRSKFFRLPLVIRGTSRDAVMICDRFGSILHANPALGRFIGEEAWGRDHLPLSRIMHPDSGHAALIDMWPAILSGQRWQGVLRCSAAWDEGPLTAVIATPMFTDRRVTGCLVVLRPHLEACTAQAGEAEPEARPGQQADFRSVAVAGLALVRGLWRRLLSRILG